MPTSSHEQIRIIDQRQSTTLALKSNGEKMLSDCTRVENWSKKGLSKILDRDVPNNASNCDEKAEGILGAWIWSQ